MTREEIAQEQLNDETKQRFLGVIPNYYMSYDPNPLPLTAEAEVHPRRTLHAGPRKLRNHRADRRRAAGK